MSVLKEQKEMLEQQMRSRRTPLTKTVGVGESTVDEPIIPGRLGPVAGPRPQKKNLRDIGVGDGDVFVVETTTTTDVGPIRIHEREVSTEQNTEVKEKEIKTVFLGGGTRDIGVLPQAASLKPKQTRSIGVGDDKVFEVSDSDSANLQVREKELRTVYIDGGGGTAAPAPKSTRNVGILCKAGMREVGVMYHYDDAAPMTRNIAVGVGEIGVSDGFELAERSDTSVHVTNMALQQLNMAAFQSRHLRFSNEQLRDVLDLMLKKNLRSVGVQCRFATVDRAVSATTAENRVSVGCSEDTVEVDVLPVRQFRSAAVDCRPSVFHRACGADFVYRVDSATNTQTQGIKVDRASNTDAVVKYPAATNTDRRLFAETVSTETEPVMFESVTTTTSGKVDEKTILTGDVSRTSSSTLGGSSGRDVVEGTVSVRGGVTGRSYSSRGGIAVGSSSTEVSTGGVSAGSRDGLAGGDFGTRGGTVGGSSGTAVSGGGGTTGSRDGLSGGGVGGTRGGTTGGSSSAVVVSDRGDTLKAGVSESTIRSSSELARQKKRDSMLFGDMDEPPLIVAGGEQYQAAHSDTTLSASSTSVSAGSDISGQMTMPSRTVSEPAFSQTASSSSHESFVCRSDEALLHSSSGTQPSRQTDTRQTVTTEGLESSEGDGSFGSVVWRGDVSGPSTLTQSYISGGGGGGGRQVYMTETRIERHRTGPDITSATTSEGSLRSIMKSSSSSDKDSSSPAVTRRRISFIDSAEQGRYDPHEFCCLSVCLLHDLVLGMSCYERENRAVCES